MNNMESRKFMVEQLLLGRPSFNYLNHLHQPSSAFRIAMPDDDDDQLHPTLDLLNVVAAAGPSLRHTSSSPLLPLLDCDLEPDSPLPSGWEKCLNLKTGSIYYLNRSTGITSFDHPSISQIHSRINRADLNSIWPPPSPTTSELTVEATHVVEACKSNGVKQQHILNMNEKPKREAAQYAQGGKDYTGGEQYGSEKEGGDLDLNLSLHVVGYSSAARKPSTPLSTKLELESVVLPASSSSCSSSSSSSAASSSSSSPIISSLTFSRSINRPPKEPQSFHDILVKQLVNNQPSFAAKSDQVYNHCIRPADYSFNALDQRLKRSTISNHDAQGSLTCTSMVTVACANCLMFVMLSRSNPKCPKCGTCPNLLDLGHPPPLKKAKLQAF